MSTRITFIAMFVIVVVGCGTEPTEPGGGGGPQESYPDSVIAVIQVGSGPRDICITPDDSFVYVANGGSSDVSIIDTAALQVVTTVDVAAGPNGICANPQGGFVYVACMSGNTIAVIDTNSQQLVVSVPSTGDGTRDICCLPSGQFVYVANYISDDIDILRTSDNTIIETLQPGEWPEAICSSPDGQYVYCVNSGSGSAPNGSVVAIETSSNTVAYTLSGFDGSPAVCCLPVGNRIYAGNWHWQSYWEIAVPEMTVIDSLASDNTPNNLAVTPSGDHLLFDTGLRVVQTSDNTEVDELLQGRPSSGSASHPQEIELMQHAQVKETYTY